MSHGIGLLAQLQQTAGNASGDVEKCQVTDLACGVAQPLGHLATQGIENVGVLARQFAEFLVADLRHFTFAFGSNPGAALLFLPSRFK
ncbi:hypothetical protein D3C72_1589620 [compost metagenome]